MATTTQKKSATRHGFKTGEYIVYPAHGVGQIVSIDEQEVAGHKLEGACRQGDIDRHA